MNNNTIINNTHIGFEEYIPGNRDDNIPQYDPNNRAYCYHICDIDDGDAIRIGPNNRKILLEHIKLVSYKKDQMITRLYDVLKYGREFEQNSIRYDHPMNTNTEYKKRSPQVKSLKPNRK